jgi:hypothetical protein
MEDESTGYRGMGINYNESQGQTERAVALQEEEDTTLQYTTLCLLLLID